MARTTLSEERGQVSEAGSAGQPAGGVFGFSDGL